MEAAGFSPLFNSVTQWTGLLCYLGSFPHWERWRYVAMALQSRPLTHTSLFFSLLPSSLQMAWQHSELSCVQSSARRIWNSGWRARITRRLSRNPRWRPKPRKYLLNTSPSSLVKRWAAIPIQTQTRTHKGWWKIPLNSHLPSPAIRQCLYLNELSISIFQIVYFDLLEKT